MNNAKGIIQDEVYFITTTVVNWIDIFTRPKYKHIVLESPCRRICSNKTNVPSDLQSAGIEYKDFQSAYFLFFDL